MIFVHVKINVSFHLELQKVWEEGFGYIPTRDSEGSI